VEIESIDVAEVETAVKLVNIHEKLSEIPDRTFLIRVEARPAA
jgi:hypothetical protein